MLELVASCCDLLDVVVCSLKPVKLLAQQVPTFLLFCDRRSVTPTCCVRLHRTRNNVGGCCVRLYRSYCPRMHHFSSRTLKKVGTRCVHFDEPLTTIFIIALCSPQAVSAFPVKFLKVKGANFPKNLATSEFVETMNIFRIYLQRQKLVTL